VANTSAYIRGMWKLFRRKLGPNDLSENLAEIISLSRQEAIRLDNDFIHFVHFLLAVLADKSSSVYRVLNDSTLNLTTLQSELENIFKGRTKQRSVTVAGSLPLTKDLEKAISKAFRIALRQGAQKVEAVHVVLGVLQAPNSPAASIVQDLGLTAELLLQHSSH
jgi:ATP-dependent Clp protease ATP-binding subunit ClpA